LGDSDASVIISVILVIFLIISSCVVYKFLSKYIAYLIKSAHVAVIVELADNGKISSDAGVISHGIGKVKHRFVTASIFYVIDSLVTGAVKQIQRGVSGVSSHLSAIPGIAIIARIINLFVSIVLGYVDEAVLSHVFRQNKEDAFRASTNGIVLYFQNWKSVLKNAVPIVFFLLVWGIGGSILFFFGFAALFKSVIPISGDAATYIAVFLAIALMLIIKVAVIDPFILIAIINNYNSATRDQAPAIDIYEKARKFSSKFRKLEQKIGTAPGSGDGTPPTTPQAPPTPPTPQAPPVGNDGFDGNTPPPESNESAESAEPSEPSESAEPSANSTQPESGSDAIDLVKDRVTSLPHRLTKTRVSPIIDTSSAGSAIGSLLRAEVINAGMDLLDHAVNGDDDDDEKHTTLID
jgi:hypothetical protein